MDAVVQCLSGTSMGGLADSVEALFGAQVRAGGLALLPTEERLQVETAKAQVWVPVTVLTHAVDAWAQVANVSPEELTVRGTQRTTRHTMSTILRTFLRVTTDNALIVRAPILYSRIRNAGTLTAQLRSPQEAKIVLTGWRNGTERQLLSLAVAFETILDMTGRPHARCSFKRTSDGGIMTLTWGDASVPGRSWQEH